jgi:predicted metal-dependent HD superfamily phosphohydrolase
MSPLLLPSWDRAWQGLHAQGNGYDVRDSILTRYAEPHRRYHTTQHLEECVGIFEGVRDAADHPYEVEIALWFHDAVYELKASDNESRSAKWAEKALLGAAVEPAAAKRVHDLILVTKHTQTPVTKDEQVLIDVDLSILGAAPGRFAEYQVQIRDEYAHVPSFLFRLKRRSILKSFLDRSAIYSTPPLRIELEARARTNLVLAIGGNAA